MTSDQTIDIVKHTRDCHRTLQRYYRDLKGRVASERVQLALDFLIAHEASMETALSQYETQVPHNIAQRWFKYSPNEELKRLLAEEDLPPDMSIEHLSAWVARLNDGLIQSYRQFEEASWPEPLREVMQRLVALEHEGRKRVVRALQEQVD